MSDPPQIPATPEELLEAAARLDIEAAALAAQSAAKANQARAYRELAAKQGLTGLPIAGKATGNMVTDRRLAISKGRTGLDKFAAAYRAKKLTLRSLAKKAGCSHALLSRARAENGQPIAQRWADKIATLIDWPADRAHWPNGIS